MIAHQKQKTKEYFSHLRNLVVLACDREFLKRYLTEKQNSHLQEVEEVSFTGGGRLRERGRFDYIP